MDNQRGDSYFGHCGDGLSHCGWKHSYPYPHAYAFADTHTNANPDTRAHPYPDA